MTPVQPFDLSRLLLIAGILAAAVADITWRNTTIRALENNLVILRVKEFLDQYPVKHDFFKRLPSPTTPLYQRI